MAKPRSPSQTGNMEDTANSKKEFPKLSGLSNVRRSPRWTFNSARGAEGAERRSAEAPGPGTYAAMGPDVTSRCKKGPTFSFGSAGRDMVGKQKIPGPGAYSLAKEPGGDKPSWTMTARRDKKALGVDQNSPGPGGHDLKALLGQSPRFSAGRKLLDPADTKTSPGPCDYQQADGAGGKTPSWGFGTSNRPDNTGSAHLATPGPATYDVPSTVGRGPVCTIKGRHAGPRPQAMPGPGTSGGHWSSFG